VILLKHLRSPQYAQIVCYPKRDLKELGRRLRELKELGVKAIEFAGGKTAFDVPILGKGYVGVVVMAHVGQGKVALKIRRVDADRANMQRESEMLTRANAVGVGPSLLGFTENFLVTEFVEGMLLPRWLEALRGRGTRARIRRALRGVLEQCWRLDEAGLDHGELSRAPKHIIVDSGDQPHIVDFETASVTRRVSNVTSICQYLFVGSQVAKTIRRKLGEVDKKELINSLRAYKQGRTRENFVRILEICKL